MKLENSRQPRGYRTPWILVLLLTLGGCINENSIEPVVGIKLGVITTVYYARNGRWPESLDELRSLDSQERRPTLQYLGPNKLEPLPWKELEGKVVFNPMPDGGLTITLYSIDEISRTNAMPMVFSIPKPASTNSTAMIPQLQKEPSTNYKN